MYLNSKNIKDYTVSELRSMTRGLIKEANAIIYNIPIGDKNNYMKQLAKDVIQSKYTSISSEGDRITQMNVKYLRKKELKILYNSLSAFIEADRSSRYASKLVKRKENARKKTGKALHKRLTPEEYDQMLELFDDYSEYMENYGYRTIIDSMRKYNKKNESLSFTEKIEETQKVLNDSGITVTKEKVLTYIGNEATINRLLDKGYTVDDAIKKLSTK